MEKFSKEVCNELKYYVYRLVDPRNGETFYIGKGINNRVFAHAKCALASYKDINFDSEVDDEQNVKYETIRSINDAGLEPIVIIHRYGLSERDAFLIESVLIDSYSLKIDLTNKIKGFGSFEPINAITLENNLSIKEFIDDKSNPKYIIIKVKDYWLNRNNNDRYETTRGNWRIDPNKANRYPYVLSVTNGIVRAVYKIDVNGWVRCSAPSKRSYFTGVEVKDNVAKIFLNKKIPSRFRIKGKASPVLYCE